MPAETRRLIVTGLEELASGRGDHGDWTLRRVEATSVEGCPLTVELRTFDNLPIGEPIDVEVKRRDDDRRGATFTLRLPKRRLRDQVDELAGRVDVIEGQVRELVASQAAGAPDSHLAGAGSQLTR